MEHWKNLSLENLVEEYEGVVYKEEWRQIKDFEGLYEVSNFGRVRNLESYNWPQSIKSQRFPKNGYLLVSLWKNNKERKALVHRLVAIAFIPNPKKKKTVNHKRGVRTDNRAHQLEWATMGENSSHSFRELGRRSSFSGLHGSKSYVARPVLQFTKEGDFVAKHETVTDAGKAVGCGPTGISAACRGRYKTAKGFKWKYA